MTRSHDRMSQVPFVAVTDRSDLLTLPVVSEAELTALALAADPERFASVAPEHVVFDVEDA